MSAFSLPSFSVGLVVGALLLALVAICFLAAVLSWRVVTGPWVGGPNEETRRLRARISADIYGANARICRLHQALGQKRISQETFAMAEQVRERLGALSWHRLQIIAARSAEMEGFKKSGQDQARALSTDAIVMYVEMGFATDRKFRAGVDLLELIEARSFHPDHQGQDRLGLAGEIDMFLGSTHKESEMHSQAVKLAQP